LISSRYIYNDYLAVETNCDGVESKFVKEEETSFHIHFLRFLMQFVLALLQWVTKENGQICVNCTNGPNVAGSANTSIPKLKVANANKCLSVFYQHCFAHG
jgi:hypothetical protein